jgi:hypothetical protein
MKENQTKNKIKTIEHDAAVALILDNLKDLSSEERIQLIEMIMVNNFGEPYLYAEIPEKK